MSDLFPRPRFAAEVRVNGQLVGDLPLDPHTPFVVISAAQFPVDAANFGHLKPMYGWVGSRIARLSCCIQADVELRPTGSRERLREASTSYDVQIALALDPIPWRGVIGRTLLREFRIIEKWPYYADQPFGEMRQLEMITLHPKLGSIQ